MQSPQKIADIGAAMSVAIAGTSWLTELDVIVSITAGVVAIIAGIAAAVFHITRTYRLNKDVTSRSNRKR